MAIPQCKKKGKWIGRVWPWSWLLSGSIAGWERRFSHSKFACIIMIPTDSSTPTKWVEKAQTLSKRTPISKVAGWKASLAENLCVYIRTVYFCTLATIPWTNGIVCTCCTQSWSISKLLSAEPNRIIWPATIVNCLSKLHRHCLCIAYGPSIPYIIVVINHKSSNINKPNANCVQALWDHEFIRQEPQLRFFISLLYHVHVQYSFQLRWGIVGLLKLSVVGMLAETLLYVMPNCIHFLRYSLYIHADFGMVLLQQLAANIIWRLYNLSGERNRICRTWYGRHLMRGGVKPPPAGFTPLFQNLEYIYEHISV